MVPQSIAFWASHDAFDQKLKLFTHHQVLFLVTFFQFCFEDMLNDFPSVIPQSLEVRRQKRKLLCLLQTSSIVLLRSSFLQQCFVNS